VTNVVIVVARMGSSRLPGKTMMTIEGRPMLEHLMLRLLRVREADRIVLEPISDDFKKLTINYGFMEQPNVPKALGLCRKQGLKFDIMSTSFFLGRRSVIPSANKGMPLWQDRLYIFLMRNAANPTDFFHIPPGRVVELGTQVSV